MFYKAMNFQNKQSDTPSRYPQGYPQFRSCDEELWICGQPILGVIFENHFTRNSTVAHFHLMPLQLSHIDAIYRQ